jgi:hypothetical protein
MTTFTLQDLTPEQQTQVAKHEEMHKMFQAIQPPVMPNTPLNAPEPQHTFIEMGEVLPNPDIASIINSICTQLQLLATVINQHQGNSPNTTPPEGNPPSLQETVSLTLQQAEWFKSMVRETIVDEVSLEDVVKDIVKDEVESAVEHYFNYRFDPSEHFDFGDAVADRVDEMLDDVVRERVMDSLEEVVAEKLSEASVSISF